MKRNLLPLFVLGSCALLYSSCSKDSPEDNTTLAFAAISGGAAYRMDNSARDYDRDSDMVFYDTASIVMPTVIYNQDITALQEAILKAAFDTVCTDHVEAMRSTFGKVAAESGYQLTQVVDKPDELYAADGYNLVTGDVFSMTADLLTYRVYNECIPAAGANGMHTFRFITYSIVNSRLVDLAYIFTPEGLKELPGIIASKARTMAASIGETDIKSLPSNGNFFISLDGTIAFVYQPYEVASGAQGLIAIPFYPHQLTEYMTAEGLALFHLAGQ